MAICLKASDERKKNLNNNNNTKKNDTQTERNDKLRSQMDENDKRLAKYMAI